MSSDLRDVSYWTEEMGFFTEEGLFSGSSGNGFACGAELTEDGSSLYLEESPLYPGGSISDGSVTMAYGDEVIPELSQYYATLINEADWNASGYKEGTVASDTATDIYVENYVDACILAIAEGDFGQGVTINIVDAKRGLIVTGDNDDTINIDAYSNKATHANGAWNNKFVIDTGDGRDTINLYDEGGLANSGMSGNTEFSGYEINTGNGFDYINVSGLDEAAFIETPRSVDGGNGFDVLVVNDTTNITMSNLEVIKGLDNGQSLSLTDDLLENNGISVDFSYLDTSSLPWSFEEFDGNVLFVDDLALSNDSTYSGTSVDLAGALETGIDVALTTLGVTDEFDLDADLYMTHLTNSDGEECLVISDMAVA